MQEITIPPEMIAHGAWTVGKLPSVAGNVPRTFRPLCLVGHSMVVSKTEVGLSGVFEHLHRCDCFWRSRWRDTE